MEAVYRAFAAPAPPAIEGCPCCVSTRGTDILLTTPLREITGRQLSRYVSGAFLTVGGETDFRYLLPRILDLSANDSEDAHDPEIVLGKLALANWRSWSAEEGRAIEELIDAWFEAALERDMLEAGHGWIGWEAESVLCGAARAGLPLARWLARLLEPRAEPMLADLKQRFPSELSEFWKDAPTGFRELSKILAEDR